MLLQEWAMQVHPTADLWTDLWISSTQNTVTLKSSVTRPKDKRRKSLHKMLLKNQPKLHRMRASERASEQPLWSSPLSAANYQRTIFILSVGGDRGINFGTACFHSALSLSRSCWLANPLHRLDQKCDYQRSRHICKHSHICIYIYIKKPHISCAKEHVLKTKPWEPEGISE